MISSFWFSLFRGDYWSTVEWSILNFKYLFGDTLCGFWMFLEKLKRVLSKISRDIKLYEAPLWLIKERFSYLEFFICSCESSMYRNLHVCTGIFMYVQDSSCMHRNLHVCMGIFMYVWESSMYRNLHVCMEIFYVQESSCMYGNLLCTGIFMYVQESSCMYRNLHVCMGIFYVQESSCMYGNLLCTGIFMYV